MPAFPFGAAFVFAERGADGVFDHCRNREDRQQRHDVGKGFVKCGLIRRRRLHVAWPQAAEQRMGGLVRNDVVRQAVEDRGFLAGSLAHSPAGEVAEEQPFILRGVIRVRFREGCGATFN